MPAFRFRICLCLAVWAATLIFLTVPGTSPTSHAAEPQPNVRALARVMHVQDRHTARLMALPGVVGTATGLNAQGRLVVKVFTARAGIAGIPRKLEGVPVVVEVTGELFALAPPPGKGKPPKQEKPEVDPTSWFERPVPIGVSTGHPNVTAGTIGARVVDQDGVYALSNNHIYADSNNASPGDPVLQPGPFDGGGTVEGRDDVIGWLWDYEPIKFGGGTNIIDAAIAVSDTQLLDNATPTDGYGVPASTTVDAYPGQKVKKYGRTTGLTTGHVDAVNAAVWVNYGDVDGDGKDDIAYFEQQIIVKPGKFSAGGDSGSLVVTQQGNNPVGLLFAGSFFVTVCNPIDAVLVRFGVDIDGQ